MTVLDAEDGAARYVSNRAHGVIDRAIALPLDPAATDRMAKAAEDFFADCYGLPHDNRDAAAAYEFVIKGPAGHVSIDIKWTPRSSGRLLRRIDTGHLPATVYVLVVGPRVQDLRIAGWAWGRDLVASVRDLGHGPTHALDQSELRDDMDALMAWLGFPHRERPE